MSFWFDAVKNKMMPQKSPVVPAMLHIYFAVLLLNLCCFFFPVWENSTESSQSHQSVVVWQPPTPKNTLLQHFTHTHAQTREIFPPQTTAIQMGGAGQVERWITETEISGPWQLQTAITSYCYRHQEHTDINIKHSPTLGIIADKVTLKPWSTMSFSNFRNMMTPVTNKQQKTKKEKWSSYLSILAMLKYVGGVDSV